MSRPSPAHASRENPEKGKIFSRKVIVEAVFIEKEGFIVETDKDERRVSRVNMT